MTSKGAIRPWCGTHDCEVLAFVDQMPLKQYFDTVVGFDFVRRIIVRGVRYDCTLNLADADGVMPDGLESCDPSDWRFTDGGVQDLHSG